MSQNVCRPLSKAEDPPLLDERIGIAPSVYLPECCNDAPTSIYENFKSWSMCARAAAYRTLVTLGWISVGDDRFRNAPINHSGVIQNIRDVLKKIQIPHCAWRDLQAMHVLEQFESREDEYPQSDVEKLRRVGSASI